MSGEIINLTEEQIRSAMADNYPSLGGNSQLQFLAARLVGGSFERTEWGNWRGIGSIVAAQFFDQDTQTGKLLSAIAEPSQQ